VLDSSWDSSCKNHRNSIQCFSLTRHFLFKILRRSSI
jgi:hypothetical protein